MQMMKVFLMMAGMTVFLVLLGGYFFGGGGALGFFVMAALLNFGMYWFSHKIVLKMYKAKVIQPTDAPELYRMVDDLRQRARLPMPVVAIAPQEQPNAFATGRNHKHAVVCVTAGLMKLMDKRELEGVIAHELAHIKHYHMLVSTLAATMAGAIAMIARWGFLFGGRGQNRNPIVGILIMILAPLAAVIVQMGISRTNEFQADATGAEIAGTPDGLASALQRLENFAQQIPMEVNPAGAQLAIVNPLRGGAAKGMMSLFRTHPPTEDRIAALRRLHGVVG